MSVKSDNQNSTKRIGVVAVCVRERNLLVIERSKHVAAPGAICFPGGAIEPDETESDALIREMQEELRVRAQPIRRLWQSDTAWDVDLRWWLADICVTEVLVANPQEVASFQWLSVGEIREMPGLLSSNVAFLDALSAGEFTLDAGDASNG